MSGFLTTHVLDTARGLPAVGVGLVLYRLVGQTHAKIANAITNADGRTDTPLLPPQDFTTGQYELIFFAGAYLRDMNLVPKEEGETLFLDQIPIRFGISNSDSHYHVPLLLSPYGYSTYRGS